MGETLGDIAERWMEDQGIKVPPRKTKGWKALYARWVDFAFEFFAEELGTQEE